MRLRFLPDLMLQDRAALDDLKRETRRSLELTHPHIIRIHDFVHDERSGCISMEYVDGETLASLRCRKEQKVFQPNELTVWIGQLCDALDPNGIRTRVTAVKGRCPRPLDDRVSRGAPISEVASAGASNLQASSVSERNGCYPSVRKNAAVRSVAPR